MIENQTGAAIPWLRAAVVRAVKTFAQSAIALIPAGVMISAVDWRTVIGTAALAALLSLLCSLAGLPECESGPLDNSEI